MDPKDGPKNKRPKLGEGATPTGVQPRPAHVNIHRTRTRPVPAAPARPSQEMTAVAPPPKSAAAAPAQSSHPGPSDTLADPDPAATEALDDIPLDIDEPATVVVALPTTPQRDPNPQASPQSRKLTAQAPALAESPGPSRKHTAQRPLQGAEPSQHPGPPVLSPVGVAAPRVPNSPQGSAATVDATRRPTAQRPALGDAPAGSRRHTSQRPAVAAPPEGPTQPGPAAPGVAAPRGAQPRDTVATAEDTPRLRRRATRESPDEVPLGAPLKSRPLVKRVLNAARPRRRDPWWFDSEATMIAEIDPDGVPMGIASGMTRMFESPLQAASLKFVLISTWLVMGALTLYGARDIQATVLHDESLASHESLVAAANGLQRFATAIGPARLRDGIDKALAPMKQRTPELDEAWAVDTRAPNQSPRASGRVAQAPTGRTDRPKDQLSQRILIVGASSIQFYLGAELERRFETYKNVTTHRFGKLGTGLARPDMFDWPKHLPKLLEGFKPNLVIGQFGGNDGQPLDLPSGENVLFGSEAWEKEYRRRVELIVDMVQKSGAQMVMLGMPITRHPNHSERLEAVNRVTEQATELAGGVYIPTWDLAATDDGKSRETINYQGKTGAMYLADGIHYGRLGAAYVAEKLAARMERLLELTPADENRAITVKLDLDSAARGKKTSYLAFVPQATRRSDERIPVLYLLHGAGGSWIELSEHAHFLLQELATKHRLVIVTPDGDADGWYVDSGRLQGANIQTYLLDELMPEVERRLPVSSRRSVAGISMGGNGAIAMALKRPGTFTSVSSLSGALDLTAVTGRKALIDRLGDYDENRAEWEANSALHLVRAHPEEAKKLPLLLSIGREDLWAPSNQAFHKLLGDLGIAHDYKETPGSHGWNLWLSMLPEHVAWHADRLHQTTAASAQ